MGNVLFGVLICGVLTLLPASSFGALPFITDDTGTQGAGKFQVEAAGEYSRDREGMSGLAVKQSNAALIGSLTYGLTDPIDLFIGVPYLWYSAEEECADPVREKGSGDAAIGTKWRVYGNEGVSLGIKPFLTFATGNEKEGLSSGKTGYGSLLLFTAEQGPGAVHANIGYLRNENTIDERKDLWLASALITFEVMKDLVLGADMGLATNADKASNQHPAYVLGGLIYSLNEDLELSLGIKAGLNHSENDWSVLPGVTYRF